MLKKLLQLARNIKYEIAARRRSLPDKVILGVPYCCQYARKEDADNFIKRKSHLINDPFWGLSGARSPKEYAKRARSICGMAATKMIIEYYKKTEVVLFNLVRQAYKAGVYSVEEDKVDNMKYKEYSLWIKKDYDLNARIHNRLSIKGIKWAVAKGKIPIVSVNPNIRGYSKAPSRQKGGHLVLVVGYDTKQKILYLNNPSGLYELGTQEKHKISEKEFKRYFSGRGIIVSNKKT